MKDQPNIFFVVLTGYNNEQPMAINIPDIVYVMPNTQGWSSIYLRSRNDVPICKETPDEVARLINLAVRETLKGLVSIALDLARDM